ncbi:hypothetical protein Nekkels1_35 [Cellulophaga phage Nekkels_1]|uniref:Uncharacterized protein n=1 Tax=Cellulophaga phage Nekkels_1 TaxID=2745692 RepID=A0A8E4UXF7_9CAUD|nr:hypothetical protein M1M31_gp35 [Cellulophaga phage Nekkels_1]QQO97036.1 hypothetical protein Nekkels1_35 [Cellulophaga phage Nekkels_1]QQO97129.1 hypothetical protein Nekkels2_35 [Cellulophaga phage Nekkels_2]
MNNWTKQEIIEADRLMTEYKKRDLKQKVNVLRVYYACSILVIILIISLILIEY